MTGRAGMDLRKTLVCSTVLWTVGCSSLHQPAARDEPDSPAVVSGPFRLYFKNLRKDVWADPPKPGVVNVTLLKIDPVAGLVEWSADHREGDRLGWHFNGRDWTSRHDVYSGKQERMVRVDFDTGLVLDRIVPDQVVQSGGIIFRADEIIVLTPDGGWEWLHLRPRDANSGPGPDVDVSSHPKVEYPETQIARLLWMADDWWLSRNPKVRRQAQEAYRTLLSKYGMSKTVAASRDRIDSRAEAEIEE